MNRDASEGSSLTRDEQLEVLRATLDAVDGACPVFSGPMASFTADAVPVGPSAAGGRRPGAGRVPAAPGAAPAEEGGDPDRERRAPQMGVSDAERVELPRLARHAGLLEEA